MSLTNPDTAAFDLFSVIGMCALLPISIECCAYYFVYRKDDYVRMTKSMDRLEEQLKRLESNTTTGQSAKEQKRDAKKKKVLAKEQEELKRDMLTAGLKVNVVSAVVVMGLLKLLTSYYWGQVMAIAPFTPFSIFTVTTHSGLEGEDYTELNIIFIYALCNMIFRTNIQMLLNTAPRRDLSANANNLFNVPIPDEVEDEMKTYNKQD
eukprot:g2390.t1